MTTINFERLDAAITHGYEHPEEFDMDAWFRRMPCGTTACLAGTVVRQAGWEPSEFDDETGTTYLAGKDGHKRSVRYVAAELLGLAHDQVSAMFYVADLAAVIDVRNEWAREADIPERAWGAPDA